jgi:hypothetical protein
MDRFLVNFYFLLQPFYFFSASLLANAFGVRSIASLDVRGIGYRRGVKAVAYKRVPE